MKAMNLKLNRKLSTAYKQANSLYHLRRKLANNSSISALSSSEIPYNLRVWFGFKVFHAIEVM